MPLTMCSQKEFLIELKLNVFLGGFLLHLRCIFLRSVGSDWNPIWTAIFPCLTKTDICYWISNVL